MGNRKMRKVTRQIIQAWARGDSLTLGNTSTNGEAIWLHGNPIAWKTGDDDVIALTLCGWNTVTTRERLNGILHLKGAGYRFAQRDWKPVLLFERRDRNLRARNDLFQHHSGAVRKIYCLSHRGLSRREGTPDVPRINTQRNPQPAGVILPAFLLPVVFHS
jgi:hypothetical protein